MGHRAKPLSEYPDKCDCCDQRSGVVVTAYIICMLCGFLGYFIAAVLTKIIMSIAGAL
jgi:hypothetical protein